MTSDLLPELGSLADDFAFIHSLTSKTNTHGLGRPLCHRFHPRRLSLDGLLGILRPRYGKRKPTRLRFDSRPARQPAGFHQQLVQRLFARPVSRHALQRLQENPSPVSGEEFSGKTDLDGRQASPASQQRHLEQYPGDSELAARIADYELAARMQMSIPEVTDLSKEPASILKAYGADDTQNKHRGSFARNCILARRLLEKGVRFVQLFNGSYAMGEGVGNWDGHKKIEAQYPGHAHILDQPAAALIHDLKGRGLLDGVLVVWCTVRACPPFQKGASGRDHNPFGFTAWLAGAGVHAPFTYGATDEFGWKAEKDVLSLHDFHATILHLLGLDHERLSYYHNGIERRLTDVHGHVVKEVIA